MIPIDIYEANEQLINKYVSGIILIKLRQPSSLIIQLMSAFSLFSRSKSDNIKSLKPSEFKELIAQNSIQLVDVRTPEEFNERKIEGALLINIYDSNFEQMIDAKLDPTLPVAVYCHSGMRSMNAAKILAKKGFTVYNLRGGMMFWK